MEQRLYKAALEGSVTSLRELLGEDPLILDIVAVNCSDRTPLHVAAIRGHFNFVKEIVARNSELAGELDSRGLSPLHWASAKGHLEIVKTLLTVNSEMCSARDQDGRNPLHWASAKGHLEIVKTLLSVNSEMCSARDQDGRNPLHLAAIKGQVNVLKVLLQAGPDAARAIVSDKGATILHLCVQNKQLDVLKLLLETMNDRVFTNSEDEHGKTILDLAVADKKIATIKYLLSSGKMDLNARNANRLAALDNILAHSGRRDRMALEIEESVGENGCRYICSYLCNLRIKLLNLALDTRPGTDFLKDIRSGLMVVTSVIFTLTFQIGVNPPGGFWQDDLVVDSHGKPVSTPHKAGQAIMAYTSPHSYAVIKAANWMSFITSMLAMLYLSVPIPWRYELITLAMSVYMLSSCSTVVLAYAVSTSAITPDVTKQPQLRPGNGVLTLPLVCCIVIPVIIMVGLSPIINPWMRRELERSKSSSGDVKHAANRDQEDRQNIRDSP